MAWHQRMGVVAVGMALFAASILSGADHDARLALHGAESERADALLRLRQRGPDGLAELSRYVDELETQLAQNPANADELRQQLAIADMSLDEVGGAKYCRASKLYWYTDLAQAQAAARASGKPILALRMLGNLTDEHSCANSRFFRTTLYANQEISKLLRERFILTWKSVRPVPKITIDFGDGRSIERTITGNSIHYVLAPDGQVIDALPGLYGPGAFLAHLRRAEEFNRQVASLDTLRRTDRLVDYHHRQLAQIATRWEADWRACLASAPYAAQSVEVPGAVAAVESKLPTLQQLDEKFLLLESETKDALWEMFARRHGWEASLDDSSRRLIAQQMPKAEQAGRLAPTKMIVENPLLKLVRNLQNSIALDGVMNEYRHHRAIHRWLIDHPEVSLDVEKLNDKVYAEIFLMPSQDPWLGLAPPDVYSALPNQGLVRPGR